MRKNRQEGCGAFMKQFKTIHYQIRSPKLRGMKKEMTAVFLSDLHNHEYGKDNQVLLNAVRDARPDIICITGDMPVGKASCSLEPAKRFVTKLPSVCPVYYANGNHEQRMKEHPEKYGQVYGPYKKSLLKSGVILLENEKKCIDLGGVPTDITGLEIPEDAYEKISHYRLSKSDLHTRIGRADKNHYQILLAHNPAFFPQYKEWGADLVLSGHLHGGIVRIPGIGGLISPQAVLFPKYSGELTVEGDQSIVVSKGLGTHTVNVRIFNPAEMIVLHFTGGQK